MKSSLLKISTLTYIIYIGLTSNTFAQQGQITLNQDEKIDALLVLKKEMNKTENLSDRYKIQIYSGNRKGAEATQDKFNSSFNKWRSSMVYEYPNFKIWAGNFTTRLEADRALKEVKRKFSSAFIFKPKKNKN